MRLHRFISLEILKRGGPARGLRNVDSEPKVGGSSRSFQLTPRRKAEKKL